MSDETSVKRILHVVGRMDRAGAETMIMNLYRKLDRSQFQFDFLYFTSERCDFDEEIEGLGGRIFRIPDKRRNPIVRMFATAKLLKANRDIEVIHCHTLLSNAFHLLAGRMAGVKIRIAHSHNSDDQENCGMLGSLYKNISIKLIRILASHAVGCGQEASKYLFPKRTDVIFIPNAVDVDKFSAVGKNSKQYLSKKHHLSGTCLKLIHVARLTPVKNHRFTIEIARRMQEQDVDFVVFIVGKGELKDPLTRQIEEYDLGSRVFMLGGRSDIPELMAGADVMLLPSLHEGYPVVLVESQAAGLPALIADTVSAEVDLGLGLADFLPLDVHLDIWIERIKEISRKQTIGKEERISIIANKGFDARTSLKRLESLYAPKRAPAE